MRCPYCGAEDTKVTDSRPSENPIRRRRECIVCDRRFTTYERIEVIPLMVVKKDGSRSEDLTVENVAEFFFGILQGKTASIYYGSCLKV